MIRDIIEIDEELCVGCGNCVPNCHQGALQIIDGKVRLLSDLMCEGLGACVGHCPTGAMTISKREAVAYDEAVVMDKMIAGGPNVIKAHLEHLAQHKQTVYLEQAIQIITQKGIAVPSYAGAPTNNGGLTMATANPAPQAPHDDHQHGHGGCPGSRVMHRPNAGSPAHGGAPHPGSPEHAGPASELQQWPVQLHLLPPTASFLIESDLLLAADCVAFSRADFHQRFLRGKSLAIACPKLDSQQDSYVRKLTAMIDEARLNTLTVVVMEVPCCSGLVRLAQSAIAAAGRKIPLKVITISLEGEILGQEWK